MIRGMRHVISGAALVAGILLQAAPAFAQAPPWAQQQRRPSPAPQHAAARAAASACSSRSSAASAAPAAQQQPQAQPHRSRSPSPIQNVAGARGMPEQGHAAGRADRGLHRGDRRRQATSRPTMATMYFNRGEAYREKGDLDNAIKDLGESIDLDGKNASGLFQPRHGACAPRASSTTPSPTSSRRSSSIRATPTVYQHPQPRLLREARLRARHRRPDPGDQAQSEEHADDLQSRHGLSRQGRARARGAGFRSACSRLTPNDAFAFHNRGLAYRDMRDYDRAIRDFDQAIKIKPNSDRGDQRSRPRLCRQGRDRSRHRGLRPGDPDQSEGFAGLQQSRPRLSQQGRDRHRDQQLRPGDPDQPGFRAGLLQSRQRLLRQARLRPRHHRLQPGAQDQSELRAGLLRSRRRLLRPPRLREGGGRSEQGHRARCRRIRSPTTTAA